MFNWYSAPTFGAMVLFWLLAAYVLTRSPRSPISLAAVAALASTAAYLLGVGMQANATTPDEWLTWGRGFRWGAPIAPTAWYWLTALLLRQSGATSAYRRRIAIPLGWLLLAVCAVFTAGTYVDDSLWAWSALSVEESGDPSYGRFTTPAGPLYAAYVPFIVAAYAGAAANLVMGWRQARTEARRRFGWLLLSAVLFIPEVSSLAGYHWLGMSLPTSLNHLALAFAMALMAANVAAYERLRHGQVIGIDLLYFLAAWAAICLGYAAVFAVAGGGHSFRFLGLLAITLTATIIGHALAEDARRALDRLFFGSEVRHLRSNLSEVVQDAALTEDVGALLAQARAGLDEVSTEHLARLTGDALRRLNNPAALAESELIGRIPRSLAAVAAADATATEATPLQQARALREVLAEAIERLKPPDRDLGREAPAALQYHILREEYLLGMPNKQIMARHGISESTFHRNRRAAIAILAREMGKQEELLARGPVGSS